MAIAPGTPLVGNWSVGRHRARLYVISDSPNDGWSDQDNVDVYGGILVCESLFSDHAAHLIAAAPELLEALEFLANAARLTPGISPMALQQADAAIAKARGQS